MAIFADDSTLDDKRDAAFERLYGMCPAPLRTMVRSQIQDWINGATEEQLSAMLIEIDGLQARIETMAKSGDMTGIANLARAYGANDAMIAQFLPYDPTRPAL